MARTLTESERLDRQAIIESIRHWTEDYKKLKMFGGDRQSFPLLFNEKACPCCTRHLRKYAYPGATRCGRCPLLGLDKHGCERPSPYSRALTSWEWGSKPRFMAARSALLKRLTRALAKYEVTT